MKPDDIITRSNQIVGDFLSIGAYLIKVGNRVAGKYKLTQQQFVALNEIVLKEKIIQKHLVSELLFEKSNVSKIIKKLKLLGYIGISISPEDNRATVLTATDLGKDVWETGMHEFNHLDESLLESLDEQELEQIEDALDKIKNIITRRLL